jgi:hypothetical protein
MGVRVPQISNIKQNKNMYIISYITLSGTIILNHLVKETSYKEAVESIKDESMIILSIIKIEKQ